ncbi:adenosylcobinamide-GDP ribazoletransferase [Sphingomonas sp. TDK1]|uniref:adenosylcobinamide-GDP ribazoletransferase n=1 Tax=Sphingomonas sp. TDK1 TaxID=453247 RepID=UPI0007D95E43|nr:adenosylcobinamide-GDP ribazoletransferase [Sphingomonas sp. TDK1]OAN60156.1 adenosylcobinamide-GDP ribazoletransferase [Sphingomonas sp. TDK1]
MKDFVLALQFLTRLPLPPVAAGDAAFARSIRWFPAAGLVAGLVLLLGLWLGWLLDPWTGALLGLAAWVWVTGALHLDGLADIADASGAVHKGRERLREVLADPHVGSFGAVSIGLQLLAKLVLLHALLAGTGWWVVLFVPAAARFGPLVWSWWLPPLHEGLASRFRNVIRPADLILWLVLLAFAAALANPALAAAPLLIAAWGWRVRRLLGGISGDGHGAGIELVETGLLLALVIAPHLG